MNDSFCSIAKKAFFFLNENYGFMIKMAENDSIVYESPTIILSMFHDRQRSYEISLGLRRKNNPLPSFSFEEIIRSQNVPEILWPSGYSARTLNQTDRLVERFSEIISSYGIPLIEGDERAWRKISDQRDKDCVSYAAANELRTAKQAANLAWSNKDYEKVVKAYEIVRDLLNKSDTAKLNYSKKKLSK